MPTSCFLLYLRKESFIRNIFEDDSYEIIAPNFLINELFIHKETILKKAHLTENEVYELLILILNQVKFVNENIISTENFIHAFRLCNDIDEKDTTYVALALEFDCDFWTRDEILKNGLRKKGFNRFFS